MGRGSSELVALVERLDELEVAIEKVERMLVLRGDRLMKVEKLINELDCGVEELTDRVGPVDFDLSKLEDRFKELEEAFTALSSRISAVEPKPKARKKVVA